MANIAIQNFEKSVKNWWVPLLIGILLILLAFYVFQHPVENFIALATFFSLMLILSGVASALFAWFNRKSLKGWGWNLGGGMLELVLGLILLSHPDITLAILTFLLGFWLLFRGVYLISMAFEMKDYGLSNWGWVLLGGIISAILAVVVIFHPMVGAVALSIWVGLALLLTGAFTIMVAFALRKIKDKLGDVKERVQEFREEHGRGE